MSDDSMGVSAEVMARCDGCGLETRVPGLLKDQRRSFSRRRVKLCGACQVDALKYAQRTNWVLFGIFLALVAGAGLWKGDAGLVVGLVGFLAGIVLFSLLSVLMHELGHVVVAKAMGWRVCGMMMGYGKLVWQGRIGDMLLQWRFIQMGGLAMVVPTRDSGMVPLQGFLVCAAGPAVNALAAWAGWRFFVDHDARFSGTITLTGMWIVFNLLNAFLNLVPFKTSVGGVAYGSDGYQMLQAVTQPGQVRANYVYVSGIIRCLTLRQLGEVERAREVVLEHLRKYPVDVVGTQFLSVIDNDQGDFEACVATARRALYWVENDQGSNPPEFPIDEELFKKMMVAALKCNIANGILRGKVGDPAEALELARDAYESIPWMYAVQHTYGYALAWNGQVEEGLKLMVGDKAQLREEPEQSRREIMETIAEVRAMGGSMEKVGAER